MKKLLAVILAVTMALTYYPVSASAEGDNASEADTQTPPAAEPDNTHTAGVTEPEDGVSYGASIDYGDNTYYYRDLLSALSDIEDGDTIRLLSSFALSDYYYINPEGSVTIDLAG
ncbi:MAG: acid shock protein, partial [Clostridiales bacterium]|nr:acid shock protein [Clostridiales bacterium]